MAVTTHTLLWLFPVVFMFHDFEELMFWESWFTKNGAEITRRVPSFMTKQVSSIVRKSTTQFVLPVCLIFGLIVAATFIAAELQSYHLFLVSSSLFVVHGFMHLGQALVLRRYVPAVISSAVLVMPYGWFLFRRLLAERHVSGLGMAIHLLIGAVAMVPFILVMHKVGEILQEWLCRKLIG